jgi:hypothetical protein
MRTRGITGLILAIGLLIGMPSFVEGNDPPADQNDSKGGTPPRLSLVHGQVSFWRPGAEDWVQAAVNTPLAPGDQLSTGSPGALEVQVGGRAFLRGWGNVVLGLENHEPDFLQFRITAGRAAFDLRSVESGRSIEVATPNAAFVIEHPGYYRVQVQGERTSFIVRRAGRATVIPATGNPFTVAASEEIVVEGADSPHVNAFVAPALDEWDTWNYVRTDALLDAVSARYVSPGTYGVDDLDHHGTWRVVDPYGPVWVPAGVPTGWVPYSTGSWIRDPFYGWTWVDTAPWGWAPYHYGRWVYVNGFWAWAPGPLVARPIYAPALVAFLGGTGVQVRIGVGGPVVGWVALGWGEPCVPWWGRPGFMHRPWWGGWGGPRVVNNVVVDRTTVVHVDHIKEYHNAKLRNGVVVVHEEKFGRGRVTPERVTLEDARRLEPTHAAPQIAESPRHFVPVGRRGVQPPEESLRRPVVATRPSARTSESTPASSRGVAPAHVPAPAPRLVPAPERREPAPVLSRPPFGKSPLERPVPDRARPPAGQQGERPRASGRIPEGQAPGTPQAVAPPPRPAPQTGGLPSASRQPTPRRETTSPAQPRPASRAAVPAPAAPASPATVTRPSPAPVAPTTPTPTARQTPAAPRPEAPAAPTPAPAPARGAAGPAPAVSRPEAARPATRPLPGEPANRLAPSRSEARPLDKGDRQERAPRGAAQGKPEAEPHGRPGK